MQAVIFIGIQAAGKSTFYISRFYRTHVRINLDMLKTRHRENILLRACIEAKQRFVVDNTNPTIESRARYMVARRAGFQMVGYYFQSTISDAIVRNEKRPIEERVPAIAIRGTLGKLELPSYAEGFDVLYSVKIGSEGNFIVEEWSGEL